MNNNFSIINYNIIFILISFLILILIIYIILYKRNKNKLYNIVSNLKNLYGESQLNNEVNMYNKNFNDYLNSIYGNYIIDENGLFVTQKSFITLKDELLINNKINFNNNYFIFIIFFNLIINIDEIELSNVYNYIISFGKLKINLKIVNNNGVINIYNNDIIFINSDLNVLIYKFNDDNLVNNNYINFSLLLDDNKFILKKIIIKNYELSDKELNFLINN